MIDAMNGNTILDPACGSSLNLMGGSGKTALAVRNLTTFMSYRGTPNIFLSFKHGISENRAQIRSAIKAVESDIVIADGQHRLSAYVTVVRPALVEPLWVNLPQVSVGFFSPFCTPVEAHLQHLKLVFRLAGILLAKLTAFFFTPVLTSKKAVAERKYFVLHETHPPATAVTTGLLQGAFQTI